MGQTGGHGMMICTTDRPRVPGWYWYRKDEKQSRLLHAAVIRSATSRTSISRVVDLKLFSVCLVNGPGRSTHRRDNAVSHAACESRGRYLDYRPGLLKENRAGGYSFGLSDPSHELRETPGTISVRKKAIGRVYIVHLTI